MDLILIPTYNRPEFLWLCLERVIADPESAGKDVWILEDAHWPAWDRDTTILRELAEVISHFQNQRSIRHVKRSPHNHFNNTFNILEGYKEAFHSGYDYIYLIEDDVMLLPGFFEWHTRVQKESVFVSCAGRHKDSLDVVNPIEENLNDPDGRVFSDSAYSSAAGVCFPRASVELIAQRIATKAVYDWIDQDRQSQQDKEIQRLMQSMGGRSVWPVAPRCYHEGWYGTGCTIAPRPSGLLSDRISYIRNILSGSQELKSDPRWGHNITILRTPMTETQ
jgi:hypothetical protein